MYEPRIGDYGVVKTSGIFGKLIRLGTLSRWNHAVIYVGDNQLVEANPTGVELKPVHYPLVAWNKHEELTDAQRQEIAAYAKSKVGAPYGFFDIFVIVLRIFGLRLPPAKLWERMAKRLGYICSELVAESYDKGAGIKLVNKEDALVTPGDLAERLIYQ